MNTMPFTLAAPIYDRLPPISRQIWNDKYRLKHPDGTPIDLTIEDTWQRVARALAGAEAEEKQDQWQRIFYSALENFKVIPAGRIIAGAGANRAVTLFNCFVMGEIPDDLNGIFHSLRESALTMQQGGGIGNVFSSFRPRGALVKRVGADASGPVSFMRVWDAACHTIKSAGQRHGAMMGMLRCDHPDIEEFIDAKRQKGQLTNFNLSVLVTDAFMDAVYANAEWPLVFGGVTYRTVNARYLWNKIMRANYEYAEPGVIYIDRINAKNNLFYCEHIPGVNPCGEQPLPHYGACDLGGMNLAALVHDPFTPDAHIKRDELISLTKTAVRMLDNVIDVSGYPLEAQKEEALNKRRIGVWMTGLADALIMCGYNYGSEEGVRVAATWQTIISRAAYQASVELAREKGAFPLFDKDQYLSNLSNTELEARGIDSDLRNQIYRHGIRNPLLTTDAPAGTTSLFAGNISSGIEPVFDFCFKRNVRQQDGSIATEVVTDYAVALFREKFGPDTPLPDTFVTAQTLKPEDHIRMQAALQRIVDSSISKTVNCPEDIPFEDFKKIYLSAYEQGCKGCTTYRPNQIVGSILESNSPAPSTETSTIPNPVPPPAPPPSAPLPRPEVLDGSTYKLKWPHSPDAFYITITDIEINGAYRPFEIFINTIMWNPLKSGIGWQSLIWISSGLYFSRSRASGSRCVQ